MCHFQFHANHGFLSKLMGHHRTHAGPLWAPCGLHMGRHGLLRHNGPLIKLAWATPLSKFLIRGRRIELASKCLRQPPHRALGELLAMFCFTFVVFDVSVCRFSYYDNGSWTAKVLDLFWFLAGYLGASWGVWGTSSRRLGASWERLGASRGRLGSVLGRPESLLGASWGVLGATWGVLGSSWGLLGVS